MEEVFYGSGKIAAGPRSISAFWFVTHAGICERVPELNEVIVEADRWIRGGNESVRIPLGIVADQVQNVGLLGEKDTLETPFTSMTLTRKDLEYFGSPQKGGYRFADIKPFRARDSSTSSA